MLTVGPEDDQNLSWYIRADEQFVEQYQKLVSKEDNSLQDNIREKVRRVCEDPLMGTLKWDRLGGLRSLHIEQLVVLWRLVPEVTSKDFTDKVNRVYLQGIVHHDDYEESIVNKRPAQPYREFVVVMGGDDVAKQYLVYDMDSTSVEGEKWIKPKGENAVVVHGTFEAGAAEDFDQELPSGTGVTTIEKVSEEIDVGVRRRRVIE